jgi:hypothetical protein
VDLSKSCGFVVDLSKSCGFVVDLSKSRRKVVDLSKSRRKAVDLLWICRKAVDLLWICRKVVEKLWICRKVVEKLWICCTASPQQIEQVELELISNGTSSANPSSTHVAPVCFMVISSLHFLLNVSEMRPIDMINHLVFNF